MHILVVIPARGGSKGIPRKNLRLLGAKPLLAYAITTALSSQYDLDIYVSSEDDEILNTAIQFSAKTHRRDRAIAEDKTTLDPVIYACYQYAMKKEEKVYDYVITLQPTSPLLTAYSLDKAIEKIISDTSIETVIAAKDNTHLSWRQENGKYLPNDDKRVNRQYLTPTFTETGAFFITKAEIMTEHNRIGQNVDLYILSNGEEIDIDTYEDWNLCEYYLQKKHIVFVTTGNSVVGLGHVYNTLLIANDILNHKVTFLVDKESKMAYDKIALKNYPVYMQEEENILDDIKNLKADVVINDRLDTSIAYMRGLDDMGIQCINFEDLGEGAKVASLVINAIYPEKNILDNHYFGLNYFVLRDEFMYAKQKSTLEDVSNILITFGGVDPNNYTKKVIDTIYTYCVKNNISITVVAGFGYNNYESLSEYPKIIIEQNISNISYYMQKADLIFTSAGRTIYEIASIGTPAVVLAQNERELTHFFASETYGFLNLGLGYMLSDETLYEHFINLLNDKSDRELRNKLMTQVDLKMGRSRVVTLIQDKIKERK